MSRLTSLSWKVDSLLSTAEGLEYCTAPFLVIQTYLLIMWTECHPKYTSTPPHSGQRRQQVDVGQLHPFKTEQWGNQWGASGRLFSYCRCQMITKSQQTGGGLTHLCFHDCRSVKLQLCLLILWVWCLRTPKTAQPRNSELHVVSLVALPYGKCVHSVDLLTVNTEQVS